MYCNAMQWRNIEMIVEIDQLASLYRIKKKMDSKGEDTKIAID